MRVGRVAWGGPENSIGSVAGKLLPSVTVHHAQSPHIPCGATAATERSAVLGIHRHHTQANGWAGIGYNFVITQNGNVYDARGWGRVGAHAGTTQGNRMSVGVCFLIDGRREAPTAAALEAFQQLRAEGMKLGWLTKLHTVKLHRDWKQTECPGDKVAAAVRLLELPAMDG